MNTANPFSSVVSDSAKSAKSIAQTVAKQIAQEPWEILKQAGRQVGGQEQQQTKRDEGGQNENGRQDRSLEENKKLVEERDRVRSQRLIQALEAELSEIDKKDKEEKIVKAQEEQRVENQKKKVPNVLQEPGHRKGRRLFNFGKKTQMERQQTQTERPLPPSG